MSAGAPFALPGRMGAISRGSRNAVIAFLASLIFAIAGNIAVVMYSKRRAPGAPLSWGEAMVAATFAFLLFNLWYGVVPHQWITLADNEWSWRSDRLVAGPWGILEANRFLPFTITYVVPRDLIVVPLYGRRRSGKRPGG